MSRFHRFQLSLLTSLAWFLASSHASYAQNGMPNFGNMGNVSGMGAMGARSGGMGHFSPSVTNSLNEGRRGPARELGMFENARQERAAAKTSRNADETFSKPLKLKGFESDASSSAARRLLNRRQGDSVSARSGQNSRVDGSPFRFPPGLREVKNAHRIARDQPSPGSVSTESRAEATNSSH